MQTSLSVRFNPWFLRGKAAPAGLVLVAGLLAAGCGERIIPVLQPVLAMHVKPGIPHEALVVLPKGATASIYLNFTHVSGRIALSDIGIVNHNPDRITLFFTKSRVYVDDGDPLRIVDFAEFDSRKRNIDFHILKELPEGAKGKWLIPKPRFVTKRSIRGPTIVLFYSIDGHDGFTKVRYRALWDMPG